jgi:hypothetical protein
MTYNEKVRSGIQYSSNTQYPASLAEVTNDVFVSGVIWCKKNS